MSQPIFGGRNKVLTLNRFAKQLTGPRVKRTLRFFSCQLFNIYILEPSQTFEGWGYETGRIPEISDFFIFVNLTLILISRGLSLLAHPSYWFGSETFIYVNCI